MPGPEIFISAGEVSGDRHAASLLAELRRIRPDLGAWGVGGDRLAAAGQRQSAGIEQLSLVGITEVLPRLGSILGLLRRLKGELARHRPDVVLLVDAPDFNLRLAGAAHALGLRVIYFITPQVWAWRRGRLRDIRRTVDLALCILPFEEMFFRDAGVRAEYVGHPFVDLVRPSAPVELLRSDLGLDPVRPVIALLPGSRRSEVRALLPSLQGAARLLARRRPPPQFVVPAASPAVRPLLAPLAGDPLGTRIVEGRAWDCLAAADAAVVASGTATLETALIGTPFVAVYRMSAVSYAIARRLVSVRWASLPNLLLGEPAVPELLQRECRPETIAAAIGRLLDDPAAAVRLREKCGKVKALLGPGGAAARAAAAVAREAGWPSVSPRAGAERTMERR
jgi:lipid-A-disaccharide synthase